MVDEIVRNPVNVDEPIANYANLFKTPQIVRTEEGKVLKREDLDDALVYGVFDGDQLIAFVSMIKSKPFDKIDYVLTDPAYRQQGWIRSILSWHVENVGPLTSSERQSDHAIGMWKTFLNNPGNLRFFKYDSSTGEKTRLVPNNADAVWDGRENTLILVEEQHFPPRHPKSVRPPIRWWGFEDPDFPNP